MSGIEIPLESSDLSKHFCKFRARTVEDLPRTLVNPTNFPLDWDKDCIYIDGIPGENVDSFRLVRIYLFNLNS